MPASFHDMPVDQVEPKVGAHHPIGEYGQVHLAAVCMATKRQRNTLWNTPENGGLVRQQDHRRRIVDLRHGPGKIVEALISPPGHQFGDLIAKTRDPEGLAVLRHAQRIILENFDPG